MLSSSSSSSSLAESPVNSSENSAKNELLQNEVSCECMDGQLVTVHVSLLHQCKAFEKTLESLDLSPAELPDDFVFPVRSISVDIFKKTVEWMKHRDGKPDPVIEVDPLTGTQKWQIFNEFEKDFFKAEIGELTTLMKAGYFLDLKSLNIYASQAIADILQSKTPEQIRALLGIEDDLTEEQKEQIRQKNAWCQFSSS